MKQEVLNLLINLPRTPEELFNKAFALYRRSAGKNPQSERFLNAAGFTAVNLENLLYDLKQLHGITDAQVRMAKATPVKAEFVLTLENIANTEMADIIEFLIKKGITVPVLPEFSKGTPGNTERKQFIAFNNIISKGNTNKLMDEAISDFHSAKIVDLARALVTPAEVVAEATKEEEIAIEVTATTKEEVFTTAPDDVKEAVKLRDEFPFLDEVDCPEELYILVGKKMAHYHAYAKAHKALLVIVKENAEKINELFELNDKEIFALALSAVENFTVNQDIYAELAYYKENKTILGVHPIFAERKAKSTVDLMSIPDATTRMNNLENYIRRETKKLGAKKTTDLEKEKINKKLAAWEFELALIKAKLGFSDKK
jgi:hypothetical protein